MCESVDLCLRSDVPVAVMLSGGVDSSAIAALAKETGKEIHTITVGYKGKFDCDERSVAKRFAKEKGLIYHEIELDENDYKNSFDELTQHIDEPVTDAAAIAQWAMYKKMKNSGFKVLLGGMGGDELFYGYPYWNDLAESLYLHRYHQALFPWKGVQKKKAWLQFIFKNLKYVLFAGYPMKIADSTIGFWQYPSYLNFESDAIFNFDHQTFRFRDLNLHVDFGKCESGKEIDLIYEFNFDCIMTMAYLYLSDRLGMGNSMEIRSPLLDYQLVNFVSGLPTDLKYRKNQPKFLMKEVLKGIVPDYILYGPKKGFTPPTDYIDEVVQNYHYQFFDSKFKYYNSVLADKILSNLIK